MYFATLWLGFFWITKKLQKTIIKIVSAFVDIIKRLRLFKNEVRSLVFIKESLKCINITCQSWVGPQTTDSLELTNPYHIKETQITETQIPKTIKTQSVQRPSIGKCCQYVPGQISQNSKPLKSTLRNQPEIHAEISVSKEKELQVTKPQHVLISIVCW